jgi:hypothetical protein
MNTESWLVLVTTLHQQEPLGAGLHFEERGIVTMCDQLWFHHYGFIKSTNIQGQGITP